MVLKQFAEPYGKKGEILLAALNREHPAGKMTTSGSDKFGKVTDFVRFASGLAEELWWRTETRLRGVIEAVKRDGMVSDPAHDALIRDSIALHSVRSIPTRAYHQQSWAREKVRRSRLAETVQQNRLGMASLAVPVFSAGGTMVPAIAVIAPAETNLAATEEPLRACAHAVARAVEIYDHRWYEE